jgi:hypothetical protein
MIRQTSQNLRPPEKPISPFGQQLKEAFERAGSKRERAEG